MATHTRFASLGRIGSPGRPRLVALFLSFLALRRSRSRLARLDDHLLRDIGLDRATALAEARRAPWDAPAHWHLPGGGTRQG